MSRVGVVVACWQRARWLPMLLASLGAQTHEDWRAYVMDESDDQRHRVPVTMFGDPRLRHVPCERFGDWGYTVKADGAQLAIDEGCEWLAFPNEDQSYVPVWMATMLQHAAASGWELLYCDWLYGKAAYVVWPALPMRGRVDVGCLFVHVPLWTRLGGWGAIHHETDGAFVERAIAEGAAHGRVPHAFLIDN